MSPLWACSLAAAGFAIGRGQRAVVFRYAVPAGEAARRCCPACGYQVLTGRLLTRPLRAPSGRCPACRARIGPPALAVEASTAILLAMLAAVLRPGLVLAAACWLAVCAVPLAFIDVAVHRLPDVLTAAAYAGTAVFLLLAAASGHWHNLARAGLGGIALTGCYLVLIFAHPSGMGLGDSKMAASLGSLLAWSGWNTLLAGAFGGFLLAAIYGIALLVSGRATRKQHIAFGPFMIAGAFLVLLAYRP
jgi:leader peptidase (prepilin peptidase) / N-methyltransferase